MATRAILSRRDAGRDAGDGHRQVTVLFLLSRSSLASLRKEIATRRAQSLVRSALGIDNTPLFDDLVGAAEQRQRETYTEGLGRLHVDDQLNFRGLLNWQFG